MFRGQRRFRAARERRSEGRKSAPSLIVLLLVGLACDGTTEPESILFTFTVNSPSEVRVGQSIVLATFAKAPGPGAGVDVACTGHEWTTSDPAVATIDPMGSSARIHGVSTGVATISVTAECTLRDRHVETDTRVITVLPAT